jgi:hypothetical protein
MAMALSMFEMSRLLQPEQLHEAESIFILHTHSATQEKFSSVNGQNIYSCIPNSLPLDPGLSGNKPVNIPIFHILKTDSYFLTKPWNQLGNYQAT